jgi:hypothetical protein
MMEPAEEYGDMTLPLGDGEGKQQQQLELQQENHEDHDQLPNVEEYKAAMGHRTGGVGLKDKLKKVIGKIGPSSSADGVEERESILPRDPVERKQDPPELRNQKYEILDYELMLKKKRNTKIILQH